MVGFTRVDDHWTKNERSPKNCIMNFQGFNRFANIKSFFHVSPHVEDTLPMTRLYENLELVESIGRANLLGIAIAATSVSTDEIFVRCTGRSKHTVMMRGKPCPVGYNALVVCEARHCYGSILRSPITGVFRLPSPAQEVVEAEGRLIFANTMLPKFGHGYIIRSIDQKLLKMRRDNIVTHGTCTGGCKGIQNPEHILLHRRNYPADISHLKTAINSSAK